MRRFFAQRKHALLLLLGAVLLCVASQVCVFTGYTNFVRLSQRTTASIAIRTTPSLIAPTATKQQASHDGQYKSGKPQTTLSSTTHVPTFEAGVAYPQWTPSGYSKSDTQWTHALQDITTQTHAYWIEMPLLFYQSSLSATTVTTGVSTPTIASFIEGIQTAHAQGYHVFVTPLLMVSSGSMTWSGAISFSTQQDEQKWFASYWQALKPYILAAQQNGVEQLAIGTEEEWLQQFAPDALWNQLILNVRSVFSGVLTYDMNWTSLQKTPPSWMHNSNLTAIGVSAYLSLTNTKTRIDPQQMVALWKNIIGNTLDTFAKKLGKPILISEIGYRDSADALYHTWESSSTAPTDPTEQASACNAALANATHDPHIRGIFFWGWDDVGAFSLRNQPAATVLRHWYSALAA